MTLDDCSGVSRGLEEVLDSEDFIPSRYVLEVSSPGIERELYLLADFVKFTGHLAKVVEMICNDCKAECDKFPKIAVCTACGDACKACAAECRKTAT